MKNLIILIPGNPSVPGIYDPFLKQTVKDLQLEGESVAKVLSHLGQCNQKFVKHKEVTVHDVIEDHKSTIERLIDEHQPRQFILMGHSLGSAVAISLYEEFKKRVNEFVILCPFVGPSPNNIRYLKMFRNPVTQLGMKGVTYAGLKSKTVSYQIFKKWLGDNPFNTHIPREIKKPYYIRNFFSLVANYIEDFEQLKIKEKMKEMDKEKTFFLFAPEDYWVPEEIMHDLHEDYHCFECDGITHDFCLKEEYYSKVSKAIAQHFHSKGKMIQVPKREAEGRIRP